MLSIIIMHISTWIYLSLYIFPNNKNIYTGDLGRMVYKKDSIYMRPSHLAHNIYTLKKKHLSYKDLNKSTKINIITIGDSFSNAAMQGINPYYQDFIATYSNINVLNIPLFTPMNEIIYILDNSTLLDELHPKSLILESVQRECIDRFAQDYDIHKVVSKEKVISKLLQYHNPYENKDIDLTFRYARNINAITNNLQFLVNKYTIYNRVMISKLNQEFFSVKDSTTLLSYLGDIYQLEKVNSKTIAKVNQFMNNLARILKKKGIKLYFMPVVNKYDLYSRYIVNNPYPKSIFFEELRKLPKEYTLIDTKAILAKELNKGEKDIFYADDTHWTPKAAKAIFKRISFE